MLSEMGPKRAEEWRKNLETLIGCKGATFLLGDEPDDSIEDITARIAVEVEMEGEEEAVEDSEGDSM